MRHQADIKRLEQNGGICGKGGFGGHTVTSQRTQCTCTKRILISTKAAVYGDTLVAPVFELHAPNMEPPVLITV